jgi:hypothetical protein
MHKLKLFGRALFQFVKQIGNLPLRWLAAFQNSRAGPARESSESERLDRIRNPSKYLDRVNEP